MLDIVEMYSDCIITPLEKEKNRLQQKICSDKIKDILLRQVYEKQLDKLESVLLQKYERFEALVQEELEFIDKLNLVKKI